MNTLEDGRVLLLDRAVDSHGCRAVERAKPQIACCTCVRNVWLVCGRQALLGLCRVGEKHDGDVDDGADVGHDLPNGRARPNGR